MRDRALLEDELRKQLREAQEAYHAAARNSEELAARCPGHFPGGVEESSRREREALEHYRRTLERFSDVVLRGRRAG